MPISATTQTPPRPSSVRWSAVAGLLAWILLPVVLLIGSPAPAAAAAILQPDPAVTAAVDHFLASLPGDFLAIRTVPALKQALASPDTLLIDVRSPAEFRGGHISGAINIPLKDLGRRIEAIPADQEVVLYCSSGHRSSMGVMSLQLEGRTHVRGFPPSFDGWKAAGEPVVRSDG